MTIETGLRRRYTPPPNVASGMMSSRGRVIAVNNAQRRVDVAIDHSGVLRDVPVLCDMAGTHFGSPFVGTVDNPAGTAQTGSGPYADMTPSLTNDTFCLVGYVGGDLHDPVVLGFFFPEQFETSFEDVDVRKHHNGMYTAYTDSGVEIGHPSGLFIKIGTGTSKTDLNGGNFDSKSIPFKDSAGSATGLPDIVVKYPNGAGIRLTSAGSIIIMKSDGTSFVLEAHTHSGVTAGAGVSGAPVAV